MKHVEKICWMEAPYKPETLRRKIEVNIQDDEKLRGALIRLIEYVAKNTSYFTESTMEMIACDTFSGEAQKTIDENAELIRRGVRKLSERVYIYYKDDTVEEIEPE